MKKASISDVAKLANVSKSTVSQFLNNRFNYMGEETKKRIEHAIAKLNYQPNIVARSLKQKRSSTVGVVLSSILHEFATKVIRSIEDYFQEHNMHIILCNSDDDATKERNYINMLRAKQVDGLIVFPTGENQDLYQSIAEENYPIVFIDRTVEGLPFDAVLLNNERAVFDAMEHYVNNHHERIAIVGNTPSFSITTRQERLQAYKNSLEYFHLKYDENLVVETELDMLRIKFNTLFDLEQPPTAILAINELSFLEIFHYLKIEKRDKAKKVAVITIDDVANADILTPSITTVSQPAYQMGKKAAKLLYNRIDNPKRKWKPVTYRFNPELIIRDSSNFKL